MKEINKSLSEEIKTQKKWKWLQEHPLNFIEKRDNFYNLLEELDSFDFDDRKTLPKKIEDCINLINPYTFEVFVSDLHEETLKSKRSGWFMGSKLRVYQDFIWLLGYFETTNIHSILSKILEKCYTKVPRVGPTSQQLAGAAFYVLRNMCDPIEALVTLMNLRARTKYHQFLYSLNASINYITKEKGINISDIEDKFIDDYNLKDGKIKSSFDDFTSEIIVDSYSKVNLVWYKPDGKIQKSVPAKVKNEHSEDLKLWKNKHKDLKKALISQKNRIEQFWLQKKSWSFNDWQKYIANHELVKFITKDLIWQFTKDDKTQVAIQHNGNYVDVTGAQITNLDDTIVTLWHPCTASVEDVEAWRNFMFTHQIKQPFKQAFREIYIVTDAELNTATYSNRYLNHVVDHYKFVALAKQRIWQYESVYTHDHPYVEYKDFNIKAVLDISSRHSEAITGPLHFFNTREDKVMPLEEVPPILFSETMRDADLFIGVCSIGLRDNVEGEHRDYWESFSKYELSETGKTRKQLLEVILPKLKIAKQCEITGRYLRVDGALRTYKIHIGSGNILMEPNDEYLCIVPTTKNNLKDVFLPFDDDRTLSVVLSKAFLLADDTKITDETILSQINRK